MDCPICDKPFDTEDSFLEHLEEHKRQSFLSKPRPVHTSKAKNVSSRVPINTAHFFGRERLEKMVLPKLQNIEDVSALVHRRNFVEQIKSMISRHPFIYIPYFIEDLLNGVSYKIILDRYYIPSHIHLYNVIKKILGFDRNRYLESQYDDAFEMNMKIPSWHDKYQTIKENCEFFKDELLELTFINILRSFIIITTTDYTDTGISQQDIVRNARSLKNNYDRFKFIDKELQRSFDRYFDAGFDGMVLDVVDELHDARLLRRIPDKPDQFVGKLSIDGLKQDIINELRYKGGSQNATSIRTIMDGKYPSLQLIPGLGVLETALHELADEKLIHIEASPWSGPGLVFLSDDYQIIQQQLQQFGDGNSEFYGRKITPDAFINELHDLERGDFADHDDQVTRIAGLILAESVRLYAPHENIPEFDFTMDITNYRFRKEQKEAMKELDFQINANLFHYKVMLDEVITIQKYDLLRKSIPDGEQGVIITFEAIPSQVKYRLDQDKTLQVIDEIGLKTWVKITKKIPARKNSIAKLHRDPISKFEKRIVRINHVDYEDGLASVSVFPEMSEATVLARSLEEIPLNEPTPNDFNEFSSNYEEFLSMLFQTSYPDNITDGLFNRVVLNSVDTKDGSLFDFAYSKASLHWNECTMYCDCVFWTENRLHLCSHMICALEYAFRNREPICQTWNDPNNPMRRLFEAYFKKNVSVTLDRLSGEHDEDGEEIDDRLRNFVHNVLKIKQNRQH